MASTNYHNNPSWTTISDDKIFKRYHHTCLLYKDRYIFLIGGSSLVTFLPLAVMYDILTETHYSLPDIPLKRAFGSAILHKYLYVIGCTNNQDSSLQMYRLCLTARSPWQPIQLSIDCLPRTIFSDDKYIYIIFRTKLYLYDPISQNLTMIHITPNTCLGCITQVVQHKIYFIGGYDAFGSNSSLHVFDMTTQSWSQGPSLPVPLEYGSTVVVSNRWIIVSGGYDGPIPNNQIFIFDTITQSWTISDVGLSPSRFNHQCIVLKSQVMSIGGQHTLTFRNITEAVLSNETTFDQYSMEAIYIEHLIPSWRWQIIKDWILLRQLVDEHRATPVLISNDMNGSYESVGGEKVLVKLFTDVPVDVFRYVLEFCFDVRQV